MLKLLGSLFSIGEWLLKRIFSPKAEFNRAKNEDARIVKEHDKEASNRKLDDLTGGM